MNTSGSHPQQWINVGGSGNNIAAGAGSHAGNTYSSGQDDVRAVLDQIRALASAAGEGTAGQQAHAAVAAIETDLAKPREHRFSLDAALTALSKLGTAMPGLTGLVETLTKAIR